MERFEFYMYIYIYYIIGQKFIDSTMERETNENRTRSLDK